MDISLKEALENGKANPSMKKVWTVKWAFSFVMLFIFLMIFSGSFFRFVFNIGIFEILLFFLILPIILGLFVSYIWSHLYWSKYEFDVGPERITITRGVIGKRITNIPYERIQNVNIWRGVLERIFNIYVIQIETAGGMNVVGSGGYGTRMGAEGTIQGLKNPQPVVDYIIAKSKGREGLGDAVSKKESLGNEDKLRMLEERLIRGEISEKTYEELKKKYESS